MADRAFWECVRNLPGGPAIGGSVDMNCVALGIVEILAPENCSAGRHGDVQRPRSPCDGVCLQKFGSFGHTGDDGARDRADQVTGGQRSERMKAVANQTMRKPSLAGDTPPGGRIELSCELPVDIGSADASLFDRVALGHLQSVI